MKKLFAMVLIVGFSGIITAQKTPAERHRSGKNLHSPFKTGKHPKRLSERHAKDFHTPPEPHHAPPTPKELFQKMKAGKKKLDAKREQDLREMEKEAK